MRACVCVCCVCVTNTGPKALSPKRAYVCATNTGPKALSPKHISNIKCMLSKFYFCVTCISLNCPSFYVVIDEAS